MNGLLESGNYDFNSIFVFGSNLAGRHGKGAALCALKQHGAKHGVGEGRQGNSYAIPTKDGRLKSLSLNEIGHHVSLFLSYAQDNPDLRFKVTAIGCGLAGYSPTQIAPLFVNIPPNCELPLEFIQAIDKIKCRDLNNI